jgi:hypothetical protein
MLQGGKNPSGAWSAAIDIAKGYRVPACADCQRVLSILGVRDIYQGDIQPLIALMNSLFPSTFSVY